MIVRLVLFAFLLVLVCMDFVDYIRVGTHVYRVGYDGVDYHSIHQALSKDPAGPIDLADLTRNYQTQYRLNSPWYPSLSKLYSRLYNIDNNTDIERRIERDRAILHDTINKGTSRDVNKDAIVFSLLTGHRVVIISPTKTGFHVLDAFNELKAIGIDLPWTRTRYMYHCSSGSPQRAAVTNGCLIHLAEISPTCPSLHGQTIYLGGSPTNTVTHFVRNHITSRYPSKTDSPPRRRQHPQQQQHSTLPEKGCQQLNTAPSDEHASTESHRRNDFEFGRWGLRYSDPSQQEFDGMARRREIMPNPLLELLSNKSPKIRKRRVSKSEQIDAKKNKTREDKNAKRQARKKARKEDSIRAYDIQDLGLTADELTRLLGKDPTGEKLFADVSRNPVKAVLLHYLNSGFFSFQRWKDYCACYDGKELSEADKEDLEKEMQQQVLSDDELYKLLEHFVKCHSYTEDHLYGCAACGIRQWERLQDPCLTYEKVSLDDKTDDFPLCYTEEEKRQFNAFKTGDGGKLRLPLDESGRISEIEVWRAISVHTDSQDRLWHLHPELVDTDPHTGKQSAMICPDCAMSTKKGDRPKSSIAAGLDFGYYKRLGLTLPNLHEQLILSRSRLYFAAMKLASNKSGQTNFNIRNAFRCHAILFPCQEAELIAYLCNSDIYGENGLFDPQQLRQLFSLYCVDDDAKMDQLMRHVFGSNDILGRSWVLVQWILVLQRLNPYYRDLDVNDVDTMLKRATDVMEQVKQDLAKDLQPLDDTRTISHEASLGSDVCENQQKEIETPPASDDPANPDEHFEGEIAQSIRYSYVTYREDVVQLLATKDSRLGAMAKLADLDSTEVAELLETSRTKGPPSAASTDDSTDDCRSDPCGEQEPFYEGIEDPVPPCDAFIENIELLRSLNTVGTTSLAPTYSDGSTHYGSSPPLSAMDECSESSAVFSNALEIFPEDPIDMTTASVGGVSDASQSQYSHCEMLKDHDAVDMFKTGSAQEHPDFQRNQKFRKRRKAVFAKDDSSSQSSSSSYDTVSSGFVWQWDAEPQIAAETTSGREGNPYNEFDSGFDHHQILGTTFPHVFMRGTTYNKPVGRLSHKERFHLLNQFTQVPSQDRRLLGFLFDMMQRIRIMDGVKAHVISSRKSLRVIEELLTSTEARAKLKKACDDPDSPSSKALLNKYLPHLRFASRNVPYGAAGGAKFQWYAMEMTKRYGAANTFLTISPTTIDNPRSIRLAFSTTSNQDFPAKFGNTPYGSSPMDFIDKMRKHSRIESEGTINLPPGCIDRSARADLAMNNPVAFVLENKMMLNDILSILIGINPEDMAFFSKFESASSRKTTYYKAKKGIFGNPLCAIGVTEDHSRGTLHWHISLLSGLPPHVLERFHNLDGICTKISHVLDTMYKSELPENVHIGNIVRNVVSQQRKEWDIPASAVESISACESLLQDPHRQDTIQDLLLSETNGTTSFGERFLNHALATSTATQHHRHMKTCHKNAHGARGCRFDMPCGEAEATAGVTLIPNLPPPYWENQPSPNNRYCLPCNAYGTDPDTRLSALPLNISKKQTYRHTKKDILDPTLPDWMVFWQTAAPTIVPSLLPDVPIESRDMRSIARDLHTILRDLPNFDPATCPDFHDWLLNKCTDEQILKLWSTILELLPDANRLVPSFNPTLSWCTGSHNNASLLGGLEQAKSALFYLVPYQGKTKCPLAQSIAVLNSTLHHLDSNKSQHPTESGTLARTTKHFLTRALNRMSLQMEVSDYEIAAALLDLPAVITTDRYRVGTPSALASFATALQIENDIDEAHEDFCRRLSLATERPSTDMPHLDTFQHSTDLEHEAQTPYKHEDVLASCGPLKAIKIANDPDCPKLLVPEVSLYLHRSLELEQMSYYEFLACVLLKTGKPSQRQNPDKRIQKHFPLLPNFHGHNDCYHVLGHKQATPLLVGKPPPHPGFKPKNENEIWKKKANAFATYYLTLFRPHRLSKPPQGYDAWQDLTNWIADLENDDSIISKFRLMILDQHVQGLRTKTILKQMARDYRGRNRTLWTWLERLHYSKRKDHKSRGLSLALAPAIEKHMQESMEACSDAQNANMLAQLLHEKKQISKITEIYGATDFSREINLSDRKSCVAYARERAENNTPISANVLSLRYSLKTIQQKLRSIKDWRPSAPEHWESSKDWWKKRSNCRSAKRKCDEIRDSLKRSDLDNSQQLQLYDLYANYFLAVGTNSRKPRIKPPQIVLCHGGPGVGKSVMRDSIDKAAQACHRFTFKTSFNAINAVEMDGQTTSSALQLNNSIHPKSTGTFSPDLIRDLRRQGFNQDALVIVEEVSNQAPWHLARLESLCQHVTGNLDIPFGGVFVLLVGDLTQLGPVQASHLTDAAMDVNIEHDLRGRQPSKKKKEALDKPSIVPDEADPNFQYVRNHPYIKGTQAFLRAQWYELSTQQRSVDDVHTRLVQDNYIGKRLTFNRLKKSGYKILSQEDTDSDDWINAPILVSTNRERYTLTHCKAIHVAKSKNTVVFRWPTRYTKWKQPPNTDKKRTAAMKDPCFYEYFVAGADGFLTDNIQKHMKLTNATAVKFHSLKFPKDVEQRLRLIIKHARPGDIITLEEPPAAVNVEIQIDPSATDNAVRRAYGEFSLDNSRDLSSGRESQTYLIPIYEYSCQPSSTPTTVRNGDGFLPSKVTLQRRFPLEPAFAITVHKSEGRTLRKVIIALSHPHARGCCFKFPQVHVAFSRVRCRQDIRLLLTGESEAEQWKTLVYLGKLSPNPSIKFFFDGHRPRSHTHPNHNWANPPWSKSRANTSYRHHLEASFRKMH